MSCCPLAATCATPLSPTVSGEMAEEAGKRGGECGDVGDVGGAKDGLVRAFQLPSPKEDGVMSPAARSINEVLHSVVAFAGASRQCY